MTILRKYRSNNDSQESSPWNIAEDIVPDTDRRVIIVLSMPTYHRIEVGCKSEIQYVVEGYYREGWWIKGGYDMRNFIKYWIDFPNDTHAKVAK